MPSERVTREVWVVDVDHGESVEVVVWVVLLVVSFDMVLSFCSEEWKVEWV